MKAFRRFDIIIIFFLLFVYIISVINNFIRIIIVNKVSGGENLQNGPYKTAGRAKSGGKYEENLHHCSSIQYFSLFMMTMVWIHGQDDKES